MTLGLKVALVIIVVLCGVIAGLVAERVAKICGCSQSMALTWGGGSFIAATGLGMAMVNMFDS